MKLYRRAGKTQTTIHHEQCRYATSHNCFRWEWSTGKTARQVQDQIRGLGNVACGWCQPFQHEGVYE